MAHALRITLARMRADRALLAIVALLALIATTLLVLAPLASSSLADASVRQRIATAPPDVGAISIAGQLDIADAEGVASRLADEAGIAVDQFWIATSNGTTIDGSADDVVTTLAAAFELDDLVDWVAGSGPRPGAATLHVDAASFLDISVGDTIVTPLVPDGLVVAGLFTPKDRRDPIWFGRPAIRDGVEPGVAFTNVGPLVVAPDTLRSVSGFSAIEIRLLPRTDGLTVDDLEPLRMAPTRVAAAADRETALSNSRTESGLDVLGTDIRRSLDGTTVVVVAVLSMVAALALPAVAIAGGLLGDTRRVESALVGSRGASATQIMAAASVEAVVVALLVAAAALPAASAVLALVTAAGVEPSLDIRPRIDGPTLIALAVGMTLTIAALLIPQLSRRDFAGAQAERARDLQTPFLRRTKLDILLVVLAGAGLWRVGAAPAPASGERGVDPTVIAGPALALAGSALLALRAVALAGRALDSLLSRRPPLIGALVTRSITRRPTSTARSALLILLAVSIGSFALIHRSTWARSQSDQANAEIGRDLRAAIDQRAGRLPDQLLAPFLAAEPDIDEIELVTISTASLGGTSVDLVLRKNVAGSTDGRTNDPLTGMPIAGRTLSVEAGTVWSGDGAPNALTLSATLIDGDGLVFTTPPANLQVDRTERVELGLAQPIADQDGPLLPYRTPLRLLEVVVTAPSGLAAATPTDSDLVSAAELRLTDWRLDDTPVDVELGDGRTQAGARALVTPDDVAIEPLPDGQRIELRPGLARSLNAVSEFRFSVGDGRLDPVPVTISTSLARQGFGVGDEFDLRVARATVPAVIAGVDDVIPLLSRSDAAVIADLGAVSTAAVRRDQPPPNPTDLLLDVDQVDANDVVDQLVGPVVRSPSASDRWSRVDELRNDPAQVSIVVALSIALVGSLAAATVGLIANAVNDRRQRARDVSILRALGTSGSSLRRLLTGEALIVLGIAIAFGASIATVMGRLMLSSLAIDVEGRTVVPSPVVEVPWAHLSLLIAAITAVTVTVPQIVFRSLRRIDTATALRAGEGRG